MKLYILVIILLSTYISVFSQSYVEPGQPQPVWLKGHIEHGNRNDTFQVLFWKEYINHLNGVDRATVQLDDNGNFNIQLPAISHIARIIFLRRGTEFANLGTFAAEPGDSLQLRIYKKADAYTIDFKGRGAEKYNVINESVVIRHNFDDHRRIINTSPKFSLNERFDRLARLTDSIRSVIYRMVNQHRLDLTAEAYQFLRADCISYFENIVPLELRDAYQYTTDSQSQTQLNQTYGQFVAKSASVDKTCAAWSSEYIYSRINTELTTLFIASDKHRYTFNTLFNHLKANYNGLLGEKILMTALIDQGVKADCSDNDQDAFDACMKEAYSIVKTPYIKAKLGEFINVFTKGQPAFDFILEDSVGKKINLHDLKGNVVLMDLWFTGCTGCMQFNQKMKNEIMPHFESDPFFKVVSINTDESKSLWLNSLAKNIYSDKEHINLFTGGVNFFDVPLVQYYQIQGAPFILLVDRNGSISTRISMLQKSSEIVSLIKAELSNDAKN